MVELWQKSFTDTMVCYMGTPDCFKELILMHFSKKNIRLTKKIHISSEEIILAPTQFENPSERMSR